MLSHENFLLDFFWLFFVIFPHSLLQPKHFSLYNWFYFVCLIVFPCIKMLQSVFDFERKRHRRKWQERERQEGKKENKKQKAILDKHSSSFFLSMLTSAFSAGQHKVTRMLESLSAKIREKFARRLEKMTTFFYPHNKNTNGPSSIVHLPNSTLNMR